MRRGAELWLGRRRGRASAAETEERRGRASAAKAETRRGRASAAGAEERRGRATAAEAEKRRGRASAAEAEESGAGQVAEADREQRERSRASCWLKEVEAERGAAEAVVEKSSRPIERVDVAEDSWKEVEGHQCSDDVVEQRSPYKVGVTNINYGDKVVELISGFENAWRTKDVTASSTVWGRSGLGKVAPRSAQTRNTASVDIFLRLAVPSTSSSTASCDRDVSSSSRRRSAFAAIQVRMLTNSLQCSFLGPRGSTVGQYLDNAQKQLYVFIALLGVSRLRDSADPQVLNEQKNSKPWKEVWSGWAGKERGLYEVQLGRGKIGRS